MPTRRPDILVAQTTGVIQFSGAGTHYIIQTGMKVLYMIYVDTGSDVAFKKSLDGGLTWTVPTVIYAGTVTNLSVWYDKWSGLSSNYIHVAYTESVNDDTLYRAIDVDSADALSTQTVIFAGASTAAGGCLSIVRARGGNVYCATMIDAGTEGGFFRLPNANVPSGAWDAARTTVFEAASGDMVILAPGFAADNQDIIAIFWDASADEISRKIYDDSANTWAETSIATSMVDQAAATAFPHFNITINLTDSKIILVAWSAVDTANADLRCWTIDESSISEKTNVVLNSTDDQGLCAICLDLQTNYWWVFYAGKSDGSETYTSALKIYCKVSKDSGTTWGPETLCSLSTSSNRNIGWLSTVPRLSFGIPPVAFHDNQTLDEIKINVDCSLQRATLQIGI
jgi:hypothetical protein